MVIILCALCQRIDKLTYSIGQDLNDELGLNKYFCYASSNLLKGISVTYHNKSRVQTIAGKKINYRW